jgi:hypothetical protein
MRRMLMATAVIGVAVMVVQNWPGLVRYLKIRQM